MVQLHLRRYISAQGKDNSLQPAAAGFAAQRGNRERAFVQVYVARLLQCGVAPAACECGRVPRLRRAGERELLHRQRNKAIPRVHDITRGRSAVSRLRLLDARKPRLRQCESAYGYHKAGGYIFYRITFPGYEYMPTSAGTHRIKVVVDDPNFLPAEKTSMFHISKKDISIDNIKVYDRPSTVPMSYR